MLRRALEIALPPLLTFVILTAGAELIIAAARISPLILPAPSSVFTAAWEQRASLATGLGATAKAVVIGLAMSVTAGVVAAVALSSSRWIERAFYPYAVFFQLVPIVAIAPLLIIWFGYGHNAVVAAAFIVSIFPVIVSTLAGLASVDPAMRDLMRVYGAGRWTTLWRLKLPWALPMIFSGVRVASGLAVIGAIVGEFVGGGGLGNIVVSASRQQRTDIVFAAVLYAAALGLVLFAAVGVVSRLALRHWHPSER